MSRLGISTGVAAVAIVIALVLGVGAGYFVGSSAIQTITTTILQTRTETVVRTEVMTETVMMTETETMMVTETVMVTETEMMEVETIPSVVTINQVVEDDSVVIKAVYLDKPGYVVVHQVTLEGKPGPVIGRSELLQPGIYGNIQIAIENYQGRGELIAMLHYDDGDGVYNFPGPDKPVVVDGAIVQSLFKITNTVPSIVVSDQKIGDEKIVIIDGLFLDKPGYVAIHVVTPDGKPGPVIGNSGLLVGQLVKVPVPIAGYSDEEELIAMLHYDDGDAVYNFPGPDGPVVVDGKVVLFRFKVERNMMGMG